DAVLALRRRHEGERGEPLSAADVRSGRIEAGLLTTGMEAMSGWYRGAGHRLREINVNFSAAYSPAVALRARRPSPAQLPPGRPAEETRALVRAKLGRDDVFDALEDLSRLPAAGQVRAALQ